MKYIKCARYLPEDEYPAQICQNTSTPAFHDAPHGRCHVQPVTTVTHELVALLPGTVEECTEDSLIFSCDAKIMSHEYMIKTLWHHHHA